MGEFDGVMLAVGVFEGVLEAVLVPEGDGVCKRQSESGNGENKKASSCVAEREGGSDGLRSCHSRENPKRVPRQRACQVQGEQRRQRPLAPFLLTSLSAPFSLRGGRRKIDAFRSRSFFVRSPLPA